MANSHNNEYSDSLEQICIVKSVAKKGSKSVLLLEPKKSQCPSCNGKCATMLKPVEFIEFEYIKDDIKAGDTVMLYMNHTYLIKMVLIVFGIPLFVLFTCLISFKLLDLSADFQIIASVIALLATLILQIKFIKFSKRLSIAKVKMINL
ncbi:MAG: SoxR reducing system RseC family protein [Proteobacteria bacterium]|nr:SoxR reducing system RseC family protein [Pseudomonadota bacterium]